MKNSKSSSFEKFLGFDIKRITVFFTILEFLILVFVSIGIFGTIFIIFYPKLNLESRPIYAADDYTPNIAYRSLSASPNLENQTDPKSIIANAYSSVLSDVKFPFMISLALIISAWTVIILSVIGIWKKQAIYLIPRLIWQVFGVLGFISSIVIFSLCYQTVNMHEKITDNDNYNNGAYVAKIIFAIYISFSCLGILLDVLGFIVIFRYVKFLATARSKHVT